MSALAKQERYGYDLAEHLHGRCGLKVSDGTLYAILTRLRQEGLIRHRWEHMPAGPAVWRKEHGHWVYAAQQYIRY